MKFPHIQQHDERDCGAACLSMISKYYGANHKIAKIRELIKADSHGANFLGITSGAEKLGFDAEALEGTYDELIDSIANGEVQFPFIARIINEYGFEHFVVVYSIHDDIVILGDPAYSAIKKEKKEVFIKNWQEQIITFSPNKNFVQVNEAKGALKKYFKYLLNQKKFLAFIFALSLFITFVNVSGVIVFQYVFDFAMNGSTNISEQEEHDHEHAVEHEDSESEQQPDDNNKIIGKVESAIAMIRGKTDLLLRNLSTVCITIIIMYLLKCLLNILRGLLLAKTAKKVDVALTMSYYDHLVELPINFYGSRKTGEYMSRFNDTSKIRDAISTTVLTLMLDSIMAIACGAILFCINYILFFITICTLVLYTAIMLLFKKPIKIINHEIMEDEAMVTSYLKESIDGIETIRSYGCEKSVKQKTFSLYNAFSIKNLVASTIYISQESIVSTIESIGVVVLLWSGAILCEKNIIGLADLIIFYYLISYFITPLKNLINLQPEIQTASVAAERLDDIMDVCIESNDKPEVTTMKKDIMINDVDFRYGYRELVLEKLNMTFKAGSKTAIVGETGCGKTTLVRLLMDFDQPESGSITIGGKELYQYSPSSIRRRIAYISQEIFLFSDTIYNNLRIGNDNITDEEIEKICQKCGINHFICSLPMGYNTVLEENGRDLSCGQKQRIAIARALLRKPDILIMDEATSNLDVITEKCIQSIIDDMSEDMTCIIIAHRLNTIKSCDNIYVMENGTVVEEGTHTELIAKQGLYYTFLSQSQNN